MTSTCCGIVDHNLFAKYSVIGTLTHRAKTVCTTPELLNEELQHFREALVRCEYLRWTINKIQNKFTNNKREMVTTTPRLVTTPHKQTQVTAAKIDPQGKTQHRTHSDPIHSGPGESIRNVCAK